MVRQHDHDVDLFHLTSLCGEVTFIIAVNPLGVTEVSIAVMMTRVQETTVFLHEQVSSNVLAVVDCVNRLIALLLEGTI